MGRLIALAALPQLAVHPSQPPTPWGEKRANTSSVTRSDICPKKLGGLLALRDQVSKVQSRIAEPLERRLECGQ